MKFPNRKEIIFWLNYETNELSAPTRKTRKIHKVDPENTRPFDVAHPSGEARSTGTPITRANESPIKARSVSWKIRSIYSIPLKTMTLQARLKDSKAFFSLNLNE